VSNTCTSQRQVVGCEGRLWQLLAGDSGEAGARRRAQVRGSEEVVVRVGVGRAGGRWLVGMESCSACGEREVAWGQFFPLDRSL
jgi:hypothetical protein